MKNTKKKNGENTPPAEQRQDFDSNSCLLVKLNKYLLGAINDAHILLNFATQEGIAVDQAIVTPIIETKDLLQTNTLSAQKEAEFWKAYRTLAQSTHPVSIQSLKATQSYADSAVNFFRWWALFALVILLATQIYWVIGSTITQQIEDLPNKVATLQVTIQKLTQADPDNAGVNMEIARLEAEINTHNIELDAYYDVLEKWNSIWKWNISFIKNILKGILVWGDDVTPAPSPSSDDPSRKLIISNASAKFALWAMQLYFLPLIYGLLGATAYILRRLSNEIESKTYTRQSDTRYRLRLTLGSLSGMAVAWFVTPEEIPNVFTTLSPMAMAFLAGYGVELLFSMLDGIISKFSNEIQPKPANKPS